jgi:oxazoline/thiazoline synthase
VIARPAVHPSFAAYHAPGYGVILLSAARDVFMEGALFEQLVPALNAGLDVEQLCARLAHELSAAEVWYGLRLLDAEGCLAEPAPGAESADCLDVPGITVTRDFLAPELAAWYALALSRGESWRVACVARDEVFLSPLYRDGSSGACWDCLVASIMDGRPAAAYVHGNRLPRIPLTGTPVSITPAHLEWVTANAASDSERDIISPTRTHHIRPRASCRACAPLASRLQTEQVLDPLTGLARHVRQVVPLACDSAHVYTGVQAHARAVSDVRTLRRALSMRAGGKGTSDAHARASLAGEVIERMSASWRDGDARGMIASRAELGDRALDPNACMLFSDQQFAQRTAASTSHDPIPEPLPAGSLISWTALHSLNGEADRYVPTGLLYFDYPFRAAEPFSVADSNGNAAGDTMEDATLRALLELVERDAGGIWWYAQQRRAAIDIDAVGDPWCVDIHRQLARAGRSVHVQDITTDLGIPVCVAVALNNRQLKPRPMLGFGAGLSGLGAVRGALAELAQMIGVLEDAGDNVSEPLRDWLQTATPDNQRQLESLGTCAPRPCVVDSADNPLEWTVHRLAANGIPSFSHAFTRADVGIPVVKVVAPGLRHFRRRLAPGRLYDAPPAAADEQESRNEATVNPLTFPF